MTKDIINSTSIAVLSWVWR